MVTQGLPPLSGREREGSRDWHPIDMLHLINVARTHSDRRSMLTTPPAPHRPAGLPAAAIPAFISLYLLLGAVPALALMVSGYFFGSAKDALMANFFPYLAVVSILMLTVIVGLRRGDLWGIHLFRGLAWVLVAMIGVVALAGLALWRGGLGHGLTGEKESGAFILIAAALCCAPAFILLRGLRRVRWLNPFSSSNEWEFPVTKVG